MIDYHRIASQFYNRPLLLSRPAAETISAYLLSRVEMRRGGPASAERGGESVQVFKGREKADGSFEFHSPRTSRFHADVPLGEDGRPLPFRRTADGTAIITLVGEFVNRGAWVGASSGLISYEGFKFQMEQADRDSKTNVVVLDEESTGGEAVGAFEAAAVVRDVATRKPVIAVVNGMALSAAYAIASGASKIVTMPTGLVGSIGVVMLHLDFSKFLEDEGVKPTLIFAGEHKVDGNPYEPLPAAVREDFEREVQSFYGQFVETVVLGRKNLSAKQVRETEARVYKGQDAVDVGLADAVGTLESVLADISGGSSGRSSPSMQPKGPTMDTTEKPAATAGMIAQADHDAALAKAQTAGATAERERILGIEAIATPGHEALIAKFKQDGTTTPDQAAGAILRAERATRGQHQTAIAGVEDETGKVAASPSAAGSGAAPLPQANTAEGWRAEYAKSKELQQDFATEAEYLNYAQGVASGRIRILKTARAS